MTARLFIGDVHEVLATLPENSVDLVVTSPPFLALRSYLPSDHPDKSKEIGSEPTPGEFLDALLDVTEALDRVLAPHGSICVELGDTYSGSGGAGGDYGDQGLRAGEPKFEGSGRRNRQADVAAGILAEGRDQIAGWPLAKSLTLIPELYRFALAYGFNPLTGRETPRWRVRNVVRWHRPNPPVGALGDKFRPATSDMVIACKSRTRYFDLDAVRSVNNPDRMGEKDSGSRRTMPDGLGNNSTGWTGAMQNPAGAPPLDTWIIPTAPFKGSHYATFPPALVVKPILSMCPEKVCDAIVCTHCSEPHGGINARAIGEVAMGREALSVAEALQKELRHLRDVLRGKERVDVLSPMSMGTEASNLRSPRGEVQDDGRVGPHPPQGVHPSAGGGSPKRSQGVCAGTPAGNGKPPGTATGLVGEDSPPQRDQGRQPAGESGDRHGQDSPGECDLPPLRKRLLDSLTCPHCGATGFRECGEPSRRIVATDGPDDPAARAAARSDERLGMGSTGRRHIETRVTFPTGCWTDCGHDNYRPGVVLDPFAGSGTTLAVATGHGRDAIGIDLDSRNADLCRDRIGMFLEVVEPVGVPLA